MANDEFQNIEQFIEGFTRHGFAPENSKYDHTIYGMDFKYHGRIYRITRDTISMEKELQKKFNKNEKAGIQLYEIPCQQYPNEVVNEIELYLGIFYDVYDLLDNGIIDNVKLRDILVSEETTILSTD